MAGDGVIGALLVTLGVDTGAFEDGLKSSTNKLSGFGKAMNSLGKTVFLGLAAGAAAGGAAMVKFGIDAINVGDDIGDAAARLGVGAVEFQKLQIAAVAAGGSTEVMGTAMDKLNANLGAAHMGSKSAEAAFAALGLKSNELKTADQAFYAIAGGLEKIKDPAERAKLSMQLFGKAAGVDMIEVMGAGKAALEGFAEAGEKSGRVFSQEEIDKLGAFKTQLNVMKDSATQMATVFSGRALLSILEFGKEMKPIVTEMQKVGKQVYEYLAPSFKELGSAVASLLSGPFGQVLGVTIKAIATVVGGVFVFALKSGIDTITNIIRAGDNWYRSAELMVNRIKAAFDRLKPILDVALHPIKAVTNAFRDMEDKVTGNSYVPDMVDAIEFHFGRLPRGMTAVVTREVGIVTELFSAANDNVAAISNRIAESMAKPWDEVKKQWASDLPALLDDLKTDMERAGDLLDERLGAVFTSQILSEAEKVAVSTRIWQQYWEAKSGAKYLANGGIDLISDAPKLDLKDTGNVEAGNVETLQKEITKAMQDSADASRKAFTDLFSGGMKAAMTGDLKDFAKNWWQDVLNKSMSKAMENLSGAIYDILKGQGSEGSILSTIFGSKKDGGDGFASFFKSIFGGGKAGGGPVSGGTPYLIGELGPELFVPNTSGSIVPNDKLMSGNSGTVIIQNVMDGKIISEIAHQVVFGTVPQMIVAGHSAVAGMQAKDAKFAMGRR